MARSPDGLHAAEMTRVRAACLSHEVLHDAVEGKDMATWCDLGAQRVCLQGNGALHFATSHHHHLQADEHVSCSCQCQNHPLGAFRHGIMANKALIAVKNFDMLQSCRYDQVSLDRYTLTNRRRKVPVILVQLETLHMHRFTCTTSSQSSMRSASDSCLFRFPASETRNLKLACRNLFLL